MERSDTDERTMKRDARREMRGREGKDLRRRREEKAEQEGGGSGRGERYAVGGVETKHMRIQYGGKRNMRERDRQCVESAFKEKY